MSANTAALPPPAKTAAYGAHVCACAAGHAHLEGHTLSQYPHSMQLSTALLTGGEGFRNAMCALGSCTQACTWHDTPLASGQHTQTHTHRPVLAPAADRLAVIAT
jgi:hypothetical protein